MKQRTGLNQPGNVRIKTKVRTRFKPQQTRKDEFQQEKKKREPGAGSEQIFRKLVSAIQSTLLVSTHV